MPSAKSFDILGLWQQRVETAPAISSRLRLFLNASALPPDTFWCVQNSPGTSINLNREPQALDQIVAGSPFPDDEGRPMPNMGFSCTVLGLRGDPSKVAVGPWFHLSAGGDRQNDIRLFTDHMLDDQTDPSLVTYQIMRANLLAVARAFEPDWCQAGPVQLTDYLDFAPYVRPPMSLAWMTWFSPSLAALVEPPPRRWCTITERQTDGSLFMATSTETFDCANTTHLEQARAIHRQIDPLNYTVPFCGMKGRSDRVPPFPQL